MSFGAQAKVCVFAFGPLGSSIINALSSPHYAAHFSMTIVISPEILQAKDGPKAMNLAKWKAANLPVICLDVDKATSEELVKLMTGCDVVISTLGFRHMESTTTPDHKLLEAVKVAKVPFFIPNSFCSDVFAIERADINPLLKMKKALIKDVQMSGVNHIIFFTGPFIEYLISPFGGVDFEKEILTAPATFDTKITATSLHDAGLLLAEALMQRHQPYVKNQMIHLGSDTFTWNDIYAALEERFKKPFKKQVLTKEDLERKVEEDHAKHNLFVRFWLLWVMQKGVSWDLIHGFHHDHAKHIHLTKMKEYVLGLKDEAMACMKDHVVHAQQ